MISEETPPVRAAGKPTRVRFKVTTLLVVLGMITYLDRACIATLAPAISAEFSLSKIQMGYIFSAFALAYAAFEIPTALITERRGTRVVLSRIVIWWSAFTIATAATFGYFSLLVTRFLFGAGEAGAWPCMSQTFSRWVPQTERGRLQGMFFAGAHFSAGVTPLIIAALVPFMPWRGIFVCFGAVGLIWATIWYVWFRDDPENHAGVNAGELATIVSGRERVVVLSDANDNYSDRRRNWNVVALAVMYFPNSFVLYFCITWLPTFLKERFGLANERLVLFTGLPLVLSALGDLSGGFVSDQLTRRFGLRVGRNGVGGFAYLISALALLGVTQTNNGTLAGLLVSVAMAATMFSLPAAWGSCIEVGGRKSATVSAFMNTSGQIGSLLCPLIVAYSLRWFADWNVSIYVMSGLFLIGVGAWYFIMPEPAAPEAIAPT